MNTELIAVATALLVSVFVGVGFARQGRASRRWLIAAVPVAIVGVVAVFVLGPSVTPTIAAVAGQPVQAPRDDYVSSGACRSCHENEHRSWSDSFHSKMTQRVGPDTIIAEWKGTVGPEKMRSKLIRKADEFWVTTPDFEKILSNQKAARQLPHLPMLERRIVLTTGSHHKQIYWFSTGRNGGRELDIFPYLWLIKDRRWVPRDAAFLRPTFWPPRHETGRWNMHCIQCHATGGRPRVSTEKGKPALTDVVDFGIACESCHGSARKHVEAMRSPVKRTLAYLGLSGDKSIVQPAKISPERSVEVCGYCHGQAVYRSEADATLHNHHGQTFKPGDKLDDHLHVVDPLESPDSPRMKRYMHNNPIAMPMSFWPDGMIKMGGRELNAIKMSPCHAVPPSKDKLACTHCHRLHRDKDDPRPKASWTDDQLQAGMRGDKACTQCHKDATLASPRHTHHTIDSPGARCVNCHMPNATYTLLKATRNHMISNPDASRSANTGRPDACSLCHLDKPLAWTAQKLNAWYGQPVPALKADHQRVPASLVWGLSGHALQRALVTWHMGWKPAQNASGTDWMPMYLSQRIIDPYASVRYMAGHAMKTLPGQAEFTLDYIALPSTLNAKAAALFRSWKKTTAADASPADSDKNPTARALAEATDEQVLYKGRFTILKSDFDRLLKQRDDRIVELPE